MLAKGFFLAGGDVSDLNVWHEQIRIEHHWAGKDMRLGHACPNMDGSKRRSEEHTSELQSLRHLVCRLLLEKKRVRGSPLAAVGAGRGGTCLRVASSGR